VNLSPRETSSVKHWTETGYHRRWWSQEDLLNLEDTSERRAAVMTRARADIVADIHEKLGKVRYPKKEVADIVESVFDIIKETAQREGKVMISGFGIFIT